MPEWTQCEEAMMPAGHDQFTGLVLRSVFQNPCLSDISVLDLQEEILLAPQDL